MGSKTTSQVTNSPNPTATDAYNNVVNAATSVAQTPYSPYGGQLVAPLNKGQGNAIGELNSTFGAAQPFLQAGADANASAAGYSGLASGMFGQAATVGAPQQFSSAALQQYMSPYTQSVIDSTMANLNENDAQQSQQLSSSAMGSGAFGGDRAGVAQAELARQQDLANGQTIAGLQNEGYSQALGQFNTTNAANLASANLLGNLGQGYAGLASNAVQQGSLYGTLGSTNESTLISGASAGLQGATLGQQNQQQMDTAAYNQYMSGLSYPYQNVGFLSNIVQGIGSQEGNTQTTQGNALSSIAGLGVSSLGILGATGGLGANGYLSGLGSTLSSFSDARVKEDMAPIGKTFDGQTMWRFRYKGDPKVHTGLMAQEVEQHTPEAVGSIGGIKTVNYDTATRGAAAAGLGAPPPRRAMGGPVGLSMSPMGGPTMQGAPVMGLGARPPAAPAMVMAGGGLGARPRFDAGGAVDPTTGAPIPSGGISFNGVPGGGAGLNTSPSALISSGAGLNTGKGIGAGRPIQMQPQAGGQGLGALTSSPISFGGSGSLGAAPSSGSSTQDGSSSGDSGGGSGGLSQNAWMSVLAAGLGMMGGTSMSAAANIGAGGLEGLKMYQGLQQQDRSNAVQQQRLSLEKQGQDNTATYQQGSLKVDQQRADQAAEQMRLTAEQQRQQLAIQSGSLANSVANTNSEIATRTQTAAEGRYSRQYVPGVGYVVQDLTAPTAPPQIVPLGGGTPSTAGPPAATPPQPAPAVAAAPPPPGGASASGPAPAPSGLNQTIPGSLAPVPALASAQPGPAAPAGSGTAPAGQGAPPTPAAPSFGAGWKPTTAVPQGYVPPNQFGIYNNPGQLKGEQENAKATIEGVRGEAQAAGNLQMRLDEMDRQYAQLPKNGLLAPGQGAEARATLAKTVNQYAAGVGMQPIFDPNAVAANENLVKDRFRLGADLAKGMGGREPGFIVQQAVKANPGADNTPEAYQRITAGLRQAAQYQQDRAAFFDDYNGKFGHLNGAQQAFDQVNPPQAYANRAVVSTIDPRDVSALQSNVKNPAAAAAIDRKYGPGASAAILGQ